MTHTILELSPNQFPKNAKPGDTFDLTVTVQVSEAANSVQVTAIHNPAPLVAEGTAQTEPAPPAKPTSRKTAKARR